MPFIGTPLDTRNTFQSLQGKRFSGDGSTTAFTLDIAPSSVFDIEVFVENVRQDPNSAYSISGTTLTFTGAPSSGTNNIYVIHQAKAVGTINPSNDSVTASSIADDAVESEHLNNNIISGQTALAAIPDTTDELLISDAGTIKRIDFSLLGNAPAFFVKVGSNQSVSDDTYTTVAFDTEVYDTDSAFNTSTYKFTVPSGKAGKYIFHAHTTYSNPGFAVGERNQIYFKVNDSFVDFAGDNAASTHASADPSKSFTTQQNLSDGDIVHVQVLQQSGGTLTLQSAWARFFGYRLIGV